LNLLTGCTLSDSTECEGEKCDVINPTGGDSTGTLVVEAAGLDRVPAVSGFSQTVRVDQSAVELGDEVVVSTAKDHCIQLSTNAAGSSEFCGITVEKDKTTTVVLPTYELEPASIPTFGLLEGAKLELPPPGQLALALPGSHRFEWGHGDAIEIELGEGETAVVDLGDTSQRKTTVVTKVDSAAFPDVACLGNKPIIDIREADGTVAPLPQLDFDAADPDVDFLVGLHDSVDKDLQIIVNGFGVPLALSDTGESPTETPLFRIDVNDVEFNGAGLIPGKFSVLRLNPTTQEFKSPTTCHQARPTKTGLWVPEGTYQVSVRFQTIDGLQTQLHEISFP
jgi:hypothetical protein